MKDYFSQRRTARIQLVRVAIELESKAASRRKKKKKNNDDERDNGSSTRVRSRVKGDRKRTAKVVNQNKRIRRVYTWRVLQTPWTWVDDFYLGMVIRF